jgi:hypothetical protein
MWVIVAVAAKKQVDITNWPEIKSLMLIMDIPTNNISLHSLIITSPFNYVKQDLAYTVVPIH